MDGVCLQNKSYKPSNMAWATTELRFYHSINGQKSINKKNKRNYIIYNALQCEYIENNVDLDLELDSNCGNTPDWR